MKLRNILIAGIAAVGLSACSDYLDVESPSMFETEYVFGSTYDINLALNGLYAKLMSPMTQFMDNLTLNSDIDYKTYTSNTAGTGNTGRFDSTDESSDAQNLWRNGYNIIEHCNLFLEGLENSNLYSEDDEDIQQMKGEALVIRAIMYHEMVWYFGDLPYSLKPARETGIIFPVVDRKVILDDMIADLEAAAPKMKPTSKISEGVERIGQEMAYAQIARMALTAGGYALMPDKANPKSYGSMQRINENYREYYQKAMDAAGKVISSNSHSLTNSFIDVFVNECNYAVVNNDDPIFEIPFAKDNSGNVGYIHGPKCESNESKTDFTWGEASGGSKLHSLAPYLFDPEDVRRDYLFGNWKYTYKGEATFENNVYTIYNNKWSKLWSNSPLGNTSKGNTGINYPYMRYTDVLLMYAEAANEVNNGPTTEAKDALRQVRERAFRGASNAADKVDGYINKAAGKEAFLKAVLDERKYEFAGENMRWKDLVRNNIYGQELYYTFLRHCSVADNRLSAPNYSEELAIHDGLDPEFWDNGVMLNAYYRIVDNKTVLKNEDGTIRDIPSFPNAQMQYIEFFDLWNNHSINDVDQKVYDKSAEMYTKHRNIDNGTIGNEVCYSLYGYIYRDNETEEDFINNNGTYQSFIATPTSFPAVRYILPYPRTAIRDAAGSYVNYYGYGN